MLPFDMGDRVGLVITLILIGLITFNNLQALYRRSETEESFNWAAYLLLMAWSLLNTLGNMYRAITVDTTIDSLDELPTVLLPEWRYCSFCEQNAPPRGKHTLNSMLNWKKNLKFLFLKIDWFEGKKFFFAFFSLIISLDFGKIWKKTFLENLYDLNW